MTEALMLSLAATVIGALAASGLCLFINAQQVTAPQVVQVMLLTEHWFLKVEPGSVVFAVSLITFSSMIVSLVPSFLAARMKPVTAMHHIG
jgi:ABC-type antimicrobial peptide transport system permease subunit